MSVSCGKEEVYAGHLEDNCEVLSLAEIAVLKYNDLDLARQADSEYGIKLLGPKASERTERVSHV